MGTLKKILLSLIVPVLFAGVPALAGPATLTGTARCTMPDLLEMKALTHALERDAQAPEAVASTGPVEVKEEERSGSPTGDVMVARADTDSKEGVTVYTVCAR